MRNWRARLVGGLLLLASIGSTAMYRHIYELTRGEPAQLSEFAICLLTIVLASAGAVLLFGGSSIIKRREVPPPPRENAAQRRERTIQQLLVVGSPDCVLLDTRHGVALVLAYRAMASAAARLARPDRLSAKAGDACRRNGMRGRL